MRGKSEPNKVAQQRDSPSRIIAPNENSIAPAPEEATSYPSSDNVIESTTSIKIENTSSPAQMKPNSADRHSPHNDEDDEEMHLDREEDPGPEIQQKNESVPVPKPRLSLLRKLEESAQDSPNEHALTQSLPVEDVLLEEHEDEENSNDNTAETPENQLVPIPLPRLSLLRAREHESSSNASGREENVEKNGSSTASDNAPVPMPRSSLFRAQNDEASSDVHEEESRTENASDIPRPNGRIASPISDHEEIGPASRKRRLSSPRFSPLSDIDFEDDLRRPPTGFLNESRRYFEQYAENFACENNRFFRKNAGRGDQERTDFVKDVENQTLSMAKILKTEEMPEFFQKIVTRISEIVEGESGTTLLRMRDHRDPEEVAEREPEMQISMQKRRAVDPDNTVQLTDGIGPNRGPGRPRKRKAFQNGTTPSRMQEARRNGAPQSTEESEGRERSLEAEPVVDGEDDHEEGQLPPYLIPMDIPAIPAIRYDHNMEKYRQWYEDKDKKPGKSEEIIPIIGYNLRAMGDECFLKMKEGWKKDSLCELVGLDILKRLNVFIRPANVYNRFQRLREKMYSTLKYCIKHDMDEEETEKYFHDSITDYIHVRVIRQLFKEYESDARGRRNVFVARKAKKISKRKAAHQDDNAPVQKKQRRDDEPGPSSPERNQGIQIFSSSSRTPIGEHSSSECTAEYQLTQRRIQLEDELFTANLVNELKRLFQKNDIEGNSAQNEIIRDAFDYVRNQLKLTKTYDVLQFFKDICKSLKV